MSAIKDLVSKYIPKIRHTLLFSVFSNDPSKRDTNPLHSDFSA